MSAPAPAGPEVVGAPELPRCFGVRGALKRAAVEVITSWIPMSWWVAICAWSAPVGRWLWAAWWRRLVVRLFVGWHLAGAVVLALAGPAVADDGVATSALKPLFSWMDLADTKGIDAWEFFLSIDHGNATPGGGWRMLWAWMMSLEYETFRFLMAFAIWFVGWALSFDWLDLVLAPIRTLSDALTSMTGQFALTPLMLTVAGLSAAVWIVRGRMATGLYEASMACVIAALAVGFLANPVDRVVGQDGMILQARDTGLAAAAGLQNNGNMDAPDPRAQVTHLQSELVDTFIRQPTQLINFGRVLDAPEYGGKCVKEFDDAYLKPPSENEPGLLDRATDAAQVGVETLNPAAGLAGNVVGAVTSGGDPKPEDRVKDAIRDCEGGDGAEMKAYADNPGPGQAIGLAFLIFAGCCVMVFALYLAGRVVLSAATVIGAALKLIPGVVVAIAPAMRGQFWRTLANVAMALLQLVFAIVLLYGYLLVVRALFAADEANLIRTVVFVDVFLIAGLLLFRRAMRGLQKMSDNLAAALSKRPGAAPTAITRSAPRTAADVAYMLHSGRQLYRGGRTVAKGAATLGRVGGHTAAGAVTGGVTAAVTAARATVKVAKTAKSKWDSRTEPHGNNTSDSEVVDRSETASERLSRTVLADKAGIKHPTGVAPAARTAARLGMTPRTPPRTVSREGQTFREFLTSAGAPLMVPVTEHRHRPITSLAPPRRGRGRYTVRGPATVSAQPVPAGPAPADAASSVPSAAAVASNVGRLEVALADGRRGRGISGPSGIERGR